jgi:hypothetical protein
MKSAVRFTPRTLRGLSTPLFPGFTSRVTVSCVLASNSTPPSDVQICSQRWIAATPTPPPAVVTTALPPLDKVIDVLTVCECIAECIEVSTLEAKKIHSSKKSSPFQSTSSEHKTYLSIALTRIDILCTTIGLDAQELDSFDTFSAVLLSVKSATERCKKPQHDATAYLTNPREATIRSPYLSNDFADFLAAWMDRSVIHANPPLSKRPYQEVLDLVETCTFLHVGGDATLREAGNILTTTSALKALSMDQVVQALDSLTLVTKRVGIVYVRGISNILTRIGYNELTLRQGLVVLSSLVRVKEERSLEVVRLVTRKSIPFVSRYSHHDIIFGLRAAAFLHNVHEGYATSLIAAATAKVPTMSPSTLGALCHLMELMKGSKRSAHLLHGTALREVNRLMPAILERTKQLLGRFSLKDARYVMRCLTLFKTRHSVVFAELTRLITEG